MTERRETKQPSERAEGYEPWIGVHTLSEFVFCPRAGICSHDLAQSDDGEEDNTRPGFYHLPIFFDGELDRRRRELTKTAWVCLLVGAGTLVGMLVVGFFFHPVFYYTGMFCGAVSLAAFATLWCQIARIDSVLKDWLAVNGEVPDQNITGPTVVHWPNFFVAGYQPEEPQDAMRDDGWKLAGKPWRVLQYGNRVIPVFLRNVAEDSAAIVDDPESPKLYDQHFVRIAAYCHLVEVSMGRESPYGVVLTRGSLTGIAIPNTEETRLQLIAAIRESRKTMREMGRDGHIRPAIDEKHCRRCPHGAPVPISVSFPYRLTDEEQTTPRELMPHFAVSKPRDKNDEQRRYHSHCGDRFKQLPPHEMILRLELKELGGG